MTEEQEAFLLDSPHQSKVEVSSKRLFELKQRLPLPDNSKHTYVHTSTY